MDKVNALQNAGAIVVDSPAKIGPAILKVTKYNINTSPPTYTVCSQAMKEAGLA